MTAGPDDGPGPLAVLLEDAHCLAVAKPAGLLTQGRSGGEWSAEDAVRAYLEPGDPSGVYVGTVHRLDRPVSGVLLWAKTPRATRRLAEQWASRSVNKEYWAVVEGVHDGEGLATWADAIGPVDPLSGRAPVGPELLRGWRRALTRVEWASEVVTPDGCSALRLRPETGRTHQLRAQASSRGWPIVGDLAYGAARPFPLGIALHARSLEFEHPTTRRRLTVEAPLPEAWGSWWRGMPA